jgi:hypothetical protein
MAFICNPSKYEEEREERESGKGKSERYYI